MADPASQRVLLTGGSSGVGFEAAKVLSAQGHQLTIVCRNQATADQARSLLPDSVHTLICDLADLGAVSAICSQLLDRGTALDALVLNAGLQYAGASEAQFSVQGIELTFAVNQLAHQLMAMRLLPLLRKSASPRVVITASEVHNPSSGAGKVGKPADLGDLEGLRAGAGFAMVNGSPGFDGNKAYKDSKLCNMITTQELHRRLHAETGITFSSLYPGCVADTPLFRNTPRAFRKIFPWFQKNITGGYVSQAVAGERVADVVANPEFAQSGVHWSWGNRQKKNGQQFSQELSEQATDPVTARRVWELSMQLVGI